VGGGSNFSKETMPLMSASAIAPTLHDPIDDQFAMTVPDHEVIARLAYALWESRSMNNISGTPEEDWYRAERQLGVGDHS
jgi:hypothetical protein